MLPGRRHRPALVSCDLILGLAFVLLGWQLFLRREAWSEGDGTV
jgi:hypothetical protein